MSETYKKCSKCSKDMNVIDDHPDCFRHRLCREDFTCEICKSWTPGRWTSYNKMVDKAIAKRATSRPTDGFPGNVLSSELGSGKPDESDQIPESRGGSDQPSLPPRRNNGGQLVNQPMAPPSANTGASVTNVSPPSGQISSGSQNLGVFPPPCGPNTMFQTGQFLGYQNPFQFMNWSDPSFSAFIDNRLKHLIQGQNSVSETIPPPATNDNSQTRGQNDNSQPQSSKQTTLSDETGSVSSRRRYDRFQNESQSNVDILDIDADDCSTDDLLHETRSIRSDVVSQADLDDSRSVCSLASNDGTLDWKGFIAKLAAELNIPIESDKHEHEFASYISDRLKGSKEKTRIQLPMEGSTIQALMDVDKEWQSHGKIRSYRARDDDKFAVKADHFSKFCKAPLLDDNIGEGVTGQFSMASSKKTTKRGNAELWKVDVGARLLLREVSYGSLITSYLDKVTSDSDRTEALQALVQIFNSMADITSRIIVNVVGARRNSHLHDMNFKNKATEAKLQNLSTVGPQLFLGKFFEILHSSAENIRDAKETQHLSKKSYAGEKRKYSDTSSSEKRRNQATSSKVPKKVEEKGHDSKSYRQRNTNRRFDRRQTHDSADKSNGKQQGGFRTPK